MSPRSWFRPGVIAPWFSRIFGVQTGFLYPPHNFGRQALGQRGEFAAAKFLRRKGFRIIERGFRARLGEIDLIALDGKSVVFVEVKTRRTTNAGRPAQSLHPRQQARLSRSATAYLKAHGLLQSASRFDVVEVLWPRGNRHPEIRHFPNAFQAIGHRQFYR